MARMTARCNPLRDGSASPVAGSVAVASAAAYLVAESRGKDARMGSHTTDLYLADEPSLRRILPEAIADARLEAHCRRVPVRPRSPRPARSVSRGPAIRISTPA